jgi:hypothetical protein
MWQWLTAAPQKPPLFRGDLYFRESWADAVDVLAARLPEALQRFALLNVKPDAVVGRRMRRILDFALAQGFRPLCASPLQLTRHSMRELWRYDWDIYPVDRLAFCSYWYTSADILMFIFEDAAPSAMTPASVRLSRLKGSSLPEQRRASDLRSVLGSPNKVLNFVHVADDPADMVRELGIFLDRGQRRALWRDLLRLSGGDHTDEVGAQIAQLEQRTPAHDLSFASALERLLRAGVIDRAAASQIERTVSRGGRLTWDEVCALVDPCDPRVDRWDFICIASSVIWLERY